MKEACIAVTALASLCVGCAKQGYMEHRARDLADISTLTLGHGYGAKLRAGPIQVGLLDQADEIGHRGGGGVANIHHSGPSHDHMGMPLYWPTDYVGEDTCWLVYGEEHFNTDRPQQGTGRRPARGERGHAARRLGRGREDARRVRARRLPRVRRHGRRRREAVHRDDGWDGGLLRVGGAGPRRSDGDGGSRRAQDDVGP